GDRLALDVLHDEVRRLIASDAGIEQPRDALVLEAREHALLLPEAGEADGVAEGAAYHLDRDRVAQVFPHGAVDRPHPTAADHLEDPVGADHAAGERSRGHAGRGGQFLGRGAEQRSRIRVGFQEGEDVRPDPRVLGVLLEEAGPVLGRQLQGFLEQAFDRRPVRRTYDNGLFRQSVARAVVPLTARAGAWTAMPSRTSSPG